MFEGKKVPLDFPMLDEQGGDTSWDDGEGNKVTLQDILDMTKNIPQKDYPTEKLAKVVLNWNDNPEEIDRISQVEISKQYPILIMVDEGGKIQWILDGNHRAQKALRAKSKTIPAKLIKPSNLDAKAKKVLLDIPMLNEDINNDIMLLEEGIMDLVKKGKEVTEEFLVKNIDPIVSKIIAAIKKGGDFVVNLLKKLFNVVEKYRKKYPTLFKVVILLILMVTTMIFSTAAQAADPGDLNYSADALNTMVGLLDKIPTDIDIADKMEAKVYLKDLQDGNLSGAYGEGAKNIASSIEVVYRDILQSAKDGDQGGMEILLQALETGKNTVMSALGVAINEAKKAKKKNTKKLNKPMRDSSGGKAYKVYVKDPKTGNIKTIRFGSGGLRAKINDKKARNAFAARHKCSTKKDKTKAGYWSCRLPRYAKLLGLKSNFGGFW
jgi:hypothetical protein